MSWERAQSLIQWLSPTEICCRIDVVRRRVSWSDLKARATKQLATWDKLSDVLCPMGVRKDRTVQEKRKLKIVLLQMPVPHRWTEYMTFDCSTRGLVVPTT